MEWLITNTIAALLMPLGIVLVLLLTALLMAWRWPLLAWRPIAIACVMLYALSTQFVANGLLYVLEPAPRDPAADPSGQAIVVLGGGTYYKAPEYGGDTVTAQTLLRLRYAARLQRALGKPVLVTGGSPEGSLVGEGQLMKQALEKDFHVPVQWVEQRSHNTLENARLSYRLLKPAGIERVYLVTHAWHMPRARRAFEHAGFAVIPAPTRFATRFELTVVDFLPRAEALHDSSLFFHEIAGIAWYYVRFLLKF
ncbi:MAG TPA: YdcF family protein [Burkholderiales bacterium]|nr:YdcF family protein [Burkholderiales bacterium]